MKHKFTWSALSIFIVYVFVGYLYIFFSDALVNALFPENSHVVQTYKGWGFITISGLLIFFLINSQIQKRNRINKELQKKSNEYYALYEEYMTQNEELSDANNYLQQSEEKFRSFVENANDIIYSVNPEGIFTYVSPTWKSMLGHDPDKIVGTKVQDYVHPEDIDLCMDFLKRVLETSQKQSGVQYRVKHRDGSWRWHQSNGAPIKNEKGNVTYMGIAHDITRQVEMMNSLKEKNVFIQTVLDNLPIGLALNKFNEGEATYINKKFEDIHGWDKNTLKNIPEFFDKVYPDKEYREKIKAQIMADITSGDPEKMHWENIVVTRKDGTKKIINAFNIPLLEQNTMISTVMDVTAQNEAQKEIKVIQQRLLRAEQVAKFGNWEFDFNNGTVSASEGAKKIYGLFENVINIDEAQSLPLTEYRAKLDEALNALVKENKPYDVEFKIKRLNDHQIRDIRSIAEYDKQRNVAFGVIHDITERVQAEERFKNYIHNSPTPVLIINNEGKYTFVNSAACNLLGYTIKEFLELSIHDIVADAANGNVPESFDQVKRKGIVRSANKQFRHKNGHFIDVTLDSIKLNDNEFIAFCRDITELKNVQRQLKDKNAELKESLKKTEEINNALKIAKQIAEENDRLKTAFLNNMSHEIRTPMNGILGFSELLASENLSKSKKQKYSDVIKSSGEQLLHIIDDILDISRLEAGQVQLVDESFPFNNIIDVVTALAENQLKEKEKQVKLKIIKELPDKHDMVVGDKARLIQILTNLAVNAVKFTDVGFIELGYRVSNKQLHIHVKDTGTGIPDDMHELIFERFRQTEHTIKNVYGGTGLGLSIVKGLVELMNGEIRLESKHGVGSTFTVTLPYRPSEMPPEASNIQSRSDKINNKTILIAEDEIVSYNLLKEYLEPFNIKIVHAKNGLEAVEKTHGQENPDLILMDIRMPDMDGYEAIRIIRKTNPDIPVIAQTAFAMIGEKAKAFEAGCNDYIAKPINKQELIRLLQRYL